jgi:hypothetical protein
MYALGASHENASIKTLGAGWACHCVSCCQWWMVTPSMVCANAVGAASGQIKDSAAKSSSHKSTAHGYSCASWRASRQLTPMSPQLSMTLQNITQRCTDTPFGKFSCLVIFLKIRTCKMQGAENKKAKIA